MLKPDGLRFLLIVSLTLSERSQGARQLGKEIAIPTRRARQI